MPEYSRNISIYLQVVMLLKQRIISGEYPPGSKLPPIRELAVEMDVTPNTLQKALATLEQDKLIYTIRTSGKYVTQSDAVLNSVRGQILRQHIRSMLDELKQYGFSKKEIADAAEEEMCKLESTYSC